MTILGLGTEPETDREPISLSALEFDVLWEHLQLGAMPLVVKVPSPGKTYEERATLEQQAWSDLEARGLGRPVALHPDIDHVLRVLARPEREVDARAYVERGVRLIVAGAGTDGAIAVLSGTEVTLRQVVATNLAATAVELLPSRPAGTGQSVSVRSADFEAAANSAGGTRQGFHAALLDRGVRPDDADALAGMIKDVLGTGNFGAAARDRHGRRQRGDRVVSFFDTEDGRYVQIRRPAPDGIMWTTISPADSRRLIHQVDALLTETVRAAAD
ncbi:MAG TPA: ESX secretion-associated protein EspG [Actinophytocola sp.]|uniref:ESX secretion-associated protein EspG n=1 Tax=Actinophytocola sp. TaxID=1872138 RepID=UPI002DB609C3|nr:ESX secretion-associated protein EspG [Actinophytocola sp.]HEU5474098.1 ESX secretion-associated protein EspG [Actinophytocola sp.]